MPNTFFVSQGQSYSCEAVGGYIWAPRHGVTNGKPAAPKFFWKNMTLVKNGDIIIHYAGLLNGGIKAISQARNDCFKSNITPELKAIASENRKGVGDWTDEGWRVDCDYAELRNPMLINFFRDNIRKYKRPKGANSAFNFDGGVCQGYLYELEKPLAYIFIEEAVKRNPALQKQEFIMEILQDLKNELQ